MSEQEETYGLEPDSTSRRRHAPPTQPNTLPGGTGDPLIDDAIRRRRSSNRLRDPKQNDTVRNAYLTPIIMFAVGFGLISAIFLGSGEPIGVVAYLLKFAITVPIGVGVFLLCCLLWIGFDAPIHLIALRLAGIYAVVDVMWIALTLTGLGCALFLIPIALYVGLLAALLEIELVEAIAVGLATFFAKYMPLYMIGMMMAA